MIVDFKVTMLGLARKRILHDSGKRLTLVLAALTALNPALLAQGKTPRDANPQYFPKGIFDDVAGADDFKAGWYASPLRAMSEPSLLEASKDKTVVAYRFLWLRTFHHPIAVRLTIRPAGTGSLTVKVTTGAGGYAPGTVSQDQSFDISKAQAQRFLELLAKAGFRSLRTQGGAGGTDGAQWILEGVQNGSYHIVDRWSPMVDKGTPGNNDYANVCVYLLDLSRIKMDAKDIY